MAGLEEKLCPVCFQEAMEHGECRNCGYHAEESSAVKDYLAPFTILKEKYLLGKSLGQGGFGITYLAENMQSGLRCCIKEYFPSGLLQGRTPDGALILADEENRPEYEEGKQQFIEEACALQELRENISVVDILDFFEENGTAYFAMELIEGCNLRVFRKNHNPKQTLKMALQMLFLLGSSLAEVHRFGMIHGDISPENILITQDGEIFLFCFAAFLFSDLLPMFFQRRIIHMECPFPALRFFIQKLVQKMLPIIYKCFGDNVAVRIFILTRMNRAIVEAKNFSIRHSEENG